VSSTAVCVCVCVCVCVRTVDIALSVYRNSAVSADTTWVPPPPSFASRSTTGGIAFGSFTAEGLALTLVGFLERFPLLENVRLGNNNLASIKEMGALRSLFDLNVRENLLTTCPGFVEPLNLRVADFGDNRITIIQGFSEGTPLRQLNLDKNRITRIMGLSQFHMLIELSLADNQITSTDGLEGLTSLQVGTCPPSLPPYPRLRPYSATFYHTERRLSFTCP
jgi:Leucine-rich repeat (LRR) protein